MARIHKLSQNLINQIAAGEVVERPASVLKELLENSIDAGSTEIDIKIKGGGVQLVEISDNGSGISRDDIDMVFESHATSKITDLNDLYSISSFGFRGEALSTIASISNIDLETKFENETGIRIKVKEGKIIDKKSSSRQSGTSIVVTDLFYNVPARRKFLKSESTEKNHILDTFLNITTIEYKVSFRITIDDKVIYTLPSRNSLIERIEDIFKYKKEDLIEIKYDGNIKIYGYIAHPRICRSVKTNSYIFVNERCIKDPLIHRAITQSYVGFMPRDLYPIYFLDLHIDPSKVDVNVHPRKLEVKWDNTQEIFNSVFTSVKGSLENTLRSETKGKLEFNAPVNTYTPKTTFLNRHPDNKKETTSSNENTFFRPYLSFGNEVSSNVTDSIPSVLPYRSVNQYLETYLIVEYENKVQIIDQHAAAERITYDIIKEKFDNAKFSKTNLLIPYELNLSPKQKNSIMDMIQIFASLGIDIEQTGSGDYSVVSLPSELSSSKISNIIEDTLSELGEEDMSLGSLNKKIEKIIATIACHSSIRGGDNLSRYEMDDLLKKLYMTKNPYSCPHGRPIIWEVDIKELEKKFGRSKLS